MTIGVNGDARRRGGIRLVHNLTTFPIQIVVDCAIGGIGLAGLAGRVYIDEGIIQDIVVQIEALRVGDAGVCQPSWVRRRKAAQGGTVVSGRLYSPPVP